MIARAAKKFLEIAKNDGLDTAIHATLERLPIYHQYKALVARFDPDRVDPWTIVWIDPNDVEWSYKWTAAHGDTDTVIDFHETKDAGRVVGGDWDRRVRIRYADLPKVNAVHERFTEGKSWAETGVFDHLSRVLEELEEFDGCTEIDEVRDRYRRIDRLYHEIAENGYKSRDELCHPLDYRCRLDVPKVHIARDGAFIQAGGSGNHRLAIGRVLDIPVEARVVVRHRKWEAIRDEIRTANSPDELSERARAQLAHPDVAGLVPSSWRSSLEVPTR